MNGVQATEDPARLNVMARLLKDRAHIAPEQQRRALYREAAATYRRSAELQTASYPLINAASVSLLAGDHDQALEDAAAVLRLLDAQPDEAETPYWRAATRAEALLLLGRQVEARATFAEAIALAPQAWEDHAATLRQFRRIVESQGGDASWLDRHRPPRSLHFGGHMSFDPKVLRRDQFDGEIGSILEEERVGFGYGALAAGADIIIAEALVARGAALHAILPGGPAAFASRSVDPFGEPWRRRFDALLEQAESVRTVRPVGLAPGRRAIGVADEIAMGAAALNAGRLESEAIQLLVPDPESASSGPTSAKAQAIWAEAGRRQRIVTTPREVSGLARSVAEPENDGGGALAVIAVETGNGAEGGSLEQRLKALQRTIGEGPAPLIAPYWTSERVLLAYQRLEDAADLALALARSGYRIGADYLIASPLADPFSRVVRLAPAAASASEAAASSTPGGSACVTEDFAAALAARKPAGVRSEYVGELNAVEGDSSLGLYVLK